MADWHWRNTMKPARFFKFDARAGYAVLILLLHFRTYTLAAVVLFLVFTWLLERQGLSMASAYRAFRSWICGPYRPPYWATKRRRMIDNG